MGFGRLGFVVTLVVGVHVVATVVAMDFETLMLFHRVREGIVLLALAALPGLLADIV